MSSHYTILHAPDIGSLMQSVNGYLQRGFIPVGGVLYVPAVSYGGQPFPPVFMQAIYVP